VSILSDETGLHVAVLMDLLPAVLDDDWLDWPSEGLAHELLDRVGESVGPITWERIQATRALLRGNSFWLSWPAFEKITAACAGVKPLFHLSQPPDPDDMCVSLLTAGEVDHPPPADEVLRYVAASCVHAGLWYLPRPLEDAQDYALELVHRNGAVVDPGAVRALLFGSADMDGLSDAVLAQAQRVLDLNERLSFWKSEVKDQRRWLPRMVASLGGS
jgi:hypothetical protein